MHLEGSAEQSWEQLKPCSCRNTEKNTYTVIIVCQQQLGEAQNVEKANAKEEYITSSKPCKLIYVHN